MDLFEIRNEIVDIRNEMDDEDTRDQRPSALADTLNEWVRRLDDVVERIDNEEDKDEPITWDTLDEAVETVAGMVQELRHQKRRR